jgi:hemin uptake protein HemP
LTLYMRTLIVCNTFSMVHPAPSPKAPPAPQRTTSEALLGAARALVIVHNGREYRLMVTQNGKLILTA